MDTRMDTKMMSVYPRWRGEHSRAKKNIVIGSGLSPLARGTHHAAAIKEQSMRFIPAGAGNTIRNDVNTLTVPVYPRWRGEHFFSRPKSS